MIQFLKRDFKFKLGAKGIILLEFESVRNRVDRKSVV